MAPTGMTMNFPDLLEGVEPAPAVPVDPRKHKQKKSKSRRATDPPMSRQDEKMLDELLSDVGSGTTSSSPVASHVIRSNGNTKGSKQSADFVDAVLIPSGKESTECAEAKVGNNTPSTNDSTRSYRSISNHDKVQSLYMPSFDPEKEGTSLSSMEGKFGQESDDDSIEAATLLQLAKNRVGWQSLQEENSKLKALLKKKDEELGLLHGQLRQAVATKCDLVVANQEMEKIHEQDIFEQEEHIFRMKAANKYILEQYSQTERELLNELIRLNDELKSLEKKRQEELDDWERLHGNEIFNKNAEISALREQLELAGLVPTTVPKPPRKPIGALLFGL